MTEKAKADEERDLRDKEKRMREQLLTKNTLRKQVELKQDVEVRKKVGDREYAEKIKQRVHFGIVIIFCRI
jgi:hypothetical protein